MANDSLAKQAGMVPAIFDQPEGAVDVAPTTGQCNFALIANSKSAQWGNWASHIKGLKSADVILVPPPSKPALLLTPFRFFLVQAKQFWAEVDDAYAIQRASWTKPSREDEKAGMHENVESVLLVFHNGKLHPARMTWRRGVCSAIQLAAETLKAAATPEWPKHSEEHKLSLGAPKPFLRFTTTVRVTERVSRSNGYKYPFAEGSVAPAGVVEWKAFAGLVADEEAMEQYALVNESYLRKLDEIKEMVG